MNRTERERTFGYSNMALNIQVNIRLHKIEFKQKFSPYLTLQRKHRLLKRLPGGFSGRL